MWMIVGLFHTFMGAYACSNNIITASSISLSTEEYSKDINYAILVINIVDF